MRKIKQTAATLFVVALFIAIHLSQIPQHETTGGFSSVSSQQEEGGLSLTVLDVGQGLSVVVQSDGQTLLYDGGDRDSSSKVVAFLKNQGITSLDYVVASHYDADHLNGIIGAIHAFPVQHVMGPDYVADTRLYQSFGEVLEQKGLNLEHPEPGQSWQLGSATATVLAPIGSGYEDQNDYSLVLRIESEGRSVLLTGDASSLSESEMLSGGVSLKSDLLVAGHHGSSTSTSAGFLKAVSPQAAVISCKKGNSYGHPSQDVMERLKGAKIPVYRTDLQGDLPFHIGEGIVQNGKDPCNDYSPGNPSDPLPTQDKPLREPGRAEDGYVLNTHTMKFHLPECSSAKDISPHNRQASVDSRDSLIAQGYTPCKNCNP